MYDVAIIGLGPVGCTAAILLAEAGLKVVAFEQDAEVYKLPRAVNLDGEIVRAFQRIGKGETINSLMQQFRPGDRFGFANSKREWLFGQDFVPFGANGWQPMNMFDQPELEQYLRDTAVSYRNVTAHIGSMVTGVANEDGGVVITAEDKDFVATYAVGCDGASSFVRKQFDIGWHDLGYDHEWLVVDVTLKDGHTLSNTTLQVCDPDRIVTYVCTKDPYRRWEFKMNPGETRETMLKDETIMSLIDSWTPRGTYEIRRAAVYQFHAATADTWRVGNVFIAGDAAHQTPPFLGQGMNAGMRDVVNLSWKLRLVIGGHARDELLDTYARERDAHAHDLVDWAVSIGRLMDHLAAVEAAQREGKPEPESPAALQSAGYGQGREQPPIRDGAIVLDQVNDTGSTGYLFRQPIVKNPEGSESRLDEFLGGGFAIVAKSEEAFQLTDYSERVIEKLGARLVNLDGYTEVRGHFDRLFKHSEAAIVRPDRLVFGHTSESVSLDELIEDLAAKLALTDP
jgi:3-(3-hydroxy-phenyl)propionate hydroxylase